jgi:Transglutaminase-like superfamily/Bacterial TSP3 repeat
VAAGAVSAHIAALTTGVLNAMLLTRLRIATAVLAAASVLAASVPLLSAQRADPPAPDAGTPRPAPVADRDPDTDGDGLPDFQEVHKYGTDPHKADTAGTGVSDGDARQRREYTYSVRAVIRVMRPYNLKALNDDYQDVRVLRETNEFAELEVVCYPLNTNAAAIRPNPNWKADYAAMTEYMKPGVTTNWDAAMRDDLLHELARDGIHPDRLTDRDMVEQVSRWLFKKSNYRSMFCTHFVHFPDGKPAVLPGLGGRFEREKGDKGWTEWEQFEHELLGKEMFARKTYGACTSAAVYQCTVLRALGIPCRMILCIPVADGSDPEQVALTEKHLTHHQVRHTAFVGLLGADQSYASHTFLEVYVGHRWRRLNSATLGQNILDPRCLGLMVHVHTFADLSDANLAPTWGARYAKGSRAGEFTHSNPYKLVEISDHFGRHANVPNPPAKEHKQITITKAYWPDSPHTPEMVRQWVAKSGRDDTTARLFIHGDEWWPNASDYLQYKVFMRRADPNFVLKAKGHPDVKATLTMTFFTHASQDVRELEVVIPPEELAKMAQGVAYTLHPVNGTPNYQWQVKDGVTLTRHQAAERRRGDPVRLFSVFFVTPLCPLW